LTCPVSQHTEVTSVFNSTPDLLRFDAHCCHMATLCAERQSAQMSKITA